MPKFKPNKFFKLKSPYNFGAADKTLVEGANTNPVEKEPANEMGNRSERRYNKLASKAEEAARSSLENDKGINKNMRLVKKANKLNKRKDLGKDDIAFGMSAYNLKPLPSVEENPGIHKLSKNVRNKMGYEMKYKMVNKEGFQMAGSPKHMSAYLQTQGGETTKETNKKKTIEERVVPGEDKKITTKRKKTWDDLRAEGWSEEKINEAKAWRKKNPDAPNVGVTETKIVKGDDQIVQDVKLDPIMEEKRMFNPTEQRQRGQMSLQAGRQSKREGLQDLVSQKAGLKTALKSNIDKVRNQEFGSRKERRDAIKKARKLKRGAMKSFRSGNFTGLQDRIVNAGVTDTRGFNAGDATLARRQAQGIDKSVRYYDTQSAIDKRVGFGGTYQDVQRQTQSGADFVAETNPNSATNTLPNKLLFQNNLKSGFTTNYFGNNMKKGGYKMKGSSYKAKK